VIYGGVCVRGGGRHHFSHSGKFKYTLQ